MSAFWASLHSQGHVVIDWGPIELGETREERSSEAVMQEMIIKKHICTRSELIELGATHASQVDRVGLTNCSSLIGEKKQAEE